MVKKTIKQVNPEDIEYGDRGPDFKNFIRSILEKGKIKEKYLDLLLTEPSLKVYNTAFTYIYADPNDNYEILEHLGDITVNKILTWYFYRRFPQLNCPGGVKVLASLASKYKSKMSFSKIALDLGFWKFVTADKNSKSTNRNKILEDVFEAFFAATELLLDSYFIIGVGYSIDYDILENILNTQDISLKFEDLHTYKTRVKQVLDGKKEIAYEYTSTQDETTKIFTSSLIIYDLIKDFKGEYKRRQGDKGKIIGVGKGNLKKVSEENAAKIGLNYLVNVRNYTEQKSEIYSELCQF